MRPTGMIDGVAVARSFLPPWRSAQMYDAASSLPLSSATFAMVGSTHYAQPIWVPRKANGSPPAIDRMAYNNSSGGTGKVVRLGIYTMGSDDLPDALLLDAGETAADGPGLHTVAFTFPYADAWFFTTIVSDSNPTMSSYTGVITPWGFAAKNSANGALRFSVSLPYTAGVTTLPSTFGASPAETNAPIRVAVRAA